MKFAVTALILPILVFSFAGTWAGVGGSSFHFVAHDAFHGAVHIKGAQISNAVASISAALAWVILAFAVFTDRKPIMIFSITALIVPLFHSVIFVESFYTAEYRNSLNHIAFLVAVSCTFIVCIGSLLSPEDDDSELSFEL